MYAGPCLVLPGPHLYLDPGELPARILADPIRTLVASKKAGGSPDQIWGSWRGGQPRLCAARPPRDIGRFRTVVTTEQQQAVDHLESYGYCVLPARIPPEMASSMAERFLALHVDPRYRNAIVGDDHYQALFGMLNLDDRVWECAAHIDTVAIARKFLGDRCRVVEACSKPTWPGAQGRAGRGRWLSGTAGCSTGLEPTAAPRRASGSTSPTTLGGSTTGSKGGTSRCGRRRTSACPRRCRVSVPVSGGGAVKRPTNTPLQNERGRRGKVKRTGRNGWNN